jgi:hypothetical protein
MLRVLMVMVLPVALGGCVARTAYNVVTAPVRAASWGVDKLTTSQAEEDEKRGRELRRDDERRGREARAAERRARDGRPD